MWSKVDLETWRVYEGNGAMLLRSKASFFKLGTEQSFRAFFRLTF